MPKKTETTKTVLSKSSALLRLLSRVHLKGIIEECVLVVADGVASVQAIDISNTTFLVATEKIKELPDCTIGIGNLSTVCRFLTDAKSVVLSLLPKKWLLLQRKGFGQIKSQLLDAESVPTAVEEPVELSTLTKKMSLEVELTAKAVEELNYFTSLITTKSVQIEAKDGIITIHSNPNDPQQFKFILTKKASKDWEGKISVFSNFLVAVMQTLNWEGDNAKASLMLGEDQPLLIKQNKNNYWAIVPIVGQ